MTVRTNEQQLVISLVVVVLLLPVCKWQWPRRPLGVDRHRNRAGGERKRTINHDNPRDPAVEEAVAEVALAKGAEIVAIVRDAAHRLGNPLEMHAQQIRNHLIFEGVVVEEEVVVDLVDVWYQLFWCVTGRLWKKLTVLLSIGLIWSALLRTKKATSRPSKFYRTALMKCRGGRKSKI
jgi:hypothetical protein